MSGWLIRDVLVVPPLGETPFHGWVEVDGSRIAAVGRGDAMPRATAAR